MRILIIRHGDPDYSIDSLTEKGFREVELLAKRLSKLNISDIYVAHKSMHGVLLKCIMLC